MLRHPALRAVLLSIILFSSVALAKSGYTVTNLISDSTAIIPAELQDPNLLNPWGISFGTDGTGFWLSDNNGGVSTAYTLNSQGVPSQDINIGIPTPGDTATSGGTLTGTVFNSTSGFQVDSKPAEFIFDTEDGTIAAWTAGSANAALVVDNSGANAVYKGLAIANDGANGTLLYATNFRLGQIDVFNSDFQPVNLGANAFVDPNNPDPVAPGEPGYAPFNIAEIGNKIYVTYAFQDSQQHDDFSAPGNGFVDVFNRSGGFKKRLITGGELDSPWGITLAPSSFGKFGGDLLVGNFGDSEINAFNPITGAFDGTLTRPNGKPLRLTNATDVPGLWGLAFGNGVAGFDPNTLYFASGDNAQFDGLFGQITPMGATPSLSEDIATPADLLGASVPEPASATILILAGGALLSRRRRSAN